MQKRLGERAGARKRGRPLKSRTSSPRNRAVGSKSTGKPRGRPRVRTRLTDVDTPLDGVSSVERGDERSYSRSQYGGSPMDEGEDGVEDEEEDKFEEAEGMQITYEDELSAQLAAEATIPSREETPMSVTSDRPQITSMKLIIPSSQIEDEDEIDSPIDAPVHSSPGRSFSLKRKIPPSSKSHSAQKKISLPYSPPKVKFAPPNPNAYLPSDPRASQQLPITSMLKRFESPEKKAAAVGNKLKVSAPTPQLPPSSPYTGILSRASTSSSIASFTSTKDTPSSPKNTLNVQASAKHTAGSKEKWNPPSARTTHKSLSSETLPSITLATPTKPSSSVLSTKSFAPLNPSSFYGSSTKSSASTKHTLTAAKPKITLHPISKSNSKPKSKRPKSPSRKSKSSSSWSISSVEDTKLVDIHPGFNPGDYEDFVGQEDYTVEKILAFKRDHGQKLYLVKWEGYPETQCTWEPLGNLAGSKSLVQEFERSRLRGG